jgi:hypothetical protein
MGKCRFCGSEGEGELFTDWVKPTFTDHDKLKPGETVSMCLRSPNNLAAAVIGMRPGLPLPHRTL